MDTYSSYNQIKMNPMAALKNAFMSYNHTYYYKVTPFKIKNAITTYQRLMDIFFFLSDKKHGGLHRKLGCEDI